MINFVFPDFPCMKWNDDDEKGKEGFEGNEGWYSDSLVEGWRVIYLNGTWFEYNAKAKNLGFGDIFADINIKAHQSMFDPSLKGHKGFMTYGENAYATLFKKGIFDTNLKILFLGHSLGASACLHTALLYKKYFNPERQVAVRTFGLPRTWGRNKLCKYYNETIKDSKGFSIGWEGTDLLYFTSFITRMKRPYDSVKLPSNTTFTKGLFHRISQLINAMGDDHQPASYIKKLKNADVFTMEGATNVLPD